MHFDVLFLVSWNSIELAKPQLSQKSSQNATGGGSCVHFLEQWISYWHYKATTVTFKTSQNATPWQMMLYPRRESITVVEIHSLEFL